MRCYSWPDETPCKLQGLDPSQGIISSRQLILLLYLFMVIFKIKFAGDCRWLALIAERWQHSIVFTVSQQRYAGAP
jgi:hypothetical protein